MKHIAYFITPHGYGHATRSIAIMEAWLARDSKVVFHVITAVDEHLFRETLGDRFVYHREVCDVGLIQQDAMNIDEDATVAALETLIDPRHNDAARLAELLRRHQVELVICDIVPLGLLAAERAGVPAVLVENFTWDFIYRGYAAQAPRVAAFAPRFAHVFNRATVHLQIDPPSEPNKQAYLVPPVARAFRTAREVTRAQLGVAAGRPLVMITTGGVVHQFDFVAALKERRDVTFLVTRQTPIEAENIIHMEQDSAFYHPDLVLASDLVVGKMGYSTLTENYHAGTPFAYIRRPDFIEGEALGAFADSHMSSAEIQIEAFLSGAWLQQLDTLLAMQPQRGEKANGAVVAAAYLGDLLMSGKLKA